MAKIHEPKRCSSQYLLLLLFSCVFVFLKISNNIPVPVNVQCLICYNSPLTQVKNNIPKNDPKPPFQDTPAGSKCVLLFFFYSSIFLFSMCTAFSGGYRELNIQLNFKKTSVPRLNLFFWSCFFFNILLSTLFCTEAFYRCIIIFGYLFTFKSEAARASLGTSQVVPAQTFQFCASGQEP